MKKVINYLLAVLVIGFAASCSRDDNNNNNTTPPVVTPPIVNNTVEVSAPIDASVTWDSTKVYLLKGNIYVRSGNTLTIPAGTIVKGDKATKGALIINRGAKLMANGTASNPIIFTSSAPAGFRNRGDWGGVVMCGYGVSNKGGSVTIEGVSGSTGDDGKYGADGKPGTTEVSSGSLTYARIEYAGIALSPNNELNSLTLGGVESATTIHHVQISAAGDDGIEVFGGNPNLKYVVLHNTWDDDLDTDQGFFGSIQYGAIFREPTAADQSTSRGFECSSGSGSATPHTKASIANITAVGPLMYSEKKKNINGNHGAAIQIDKNSEIKIHNSIALGFVEHLTTSGPGANAEVDSVVFYGTKETAAYPTSPGVKSMPKFADSIAVKSMYANVTVATAATDHSANYTSGDLNYSAPAPVLKSGSPYLTGAKDLTSVNTGLTKADYYGGFDASATGWDWSAGWLNFNPQAEAYTK